MSDKQKAFAVLQLTHQTCSEALKALKDLATKAQNQNIDLNESLETRLSDYVSLLSLLHHDATKLAIALKPSDPTYAAVISPGKSLAAHVDALVSCAYTTSAARHGQTLASEVCWSAEDVLNALESLLRVYNDADTHSSSSGNGEGEPYLVRTGVVHDAIDRARKVSHSNADAVKKRWEGILGGILDCEHEVQEMVDDEESSDDDGTGNELVDLDDGWRDLGAVSPSTKRDIKASQEELMRLKAALSLLKFTHALIKKIGVVFLRPASIITPPSHRTLDELLSTGNALLRASDDLVHALYIPQSSDSILKISETFWAHVEELRSALEAFGLVTVAPNGQKGKDSIMDLNEKTASMQLGPLSDDGEKLIKERKWFKTCLAQISKSAEGLM